jgi:hypothetical protein
MMTKFVAFLFSLAVCLPGCNAFQRLRNNRARVIDRGLKTEDTHALFRELVGFYDSNSRGLNHGGPMSMSMSMSMPTDPGTSTSTSPTTSTSKPTAAPTKAPTKAPTGVVAPTPAPTKTPTDKPTEIGFVPTKAPTAAPSSQPVILTVPEIEGTTRSRSGAPSPGATAGIVIAAVALVLAAAFVVHRRLGQVRSSGGSVSSVSSSEGASANNAQASF